ncbi:uncharacterized protein N7443_002773 [Penicillium atrosanguineum]|uniref:uncharacterized protein n=1 Tax=Penicillium atrosanguineum TaxID=1132637 RepID=UPI0023A1F274|nr:uncharacterized protein N7443_002773 [Penicillium atrosanguineum]KAJ5310312.1 hypothetical protein N7443_002773 [Penicillium atrosanguineum]
MSPRIFVTGATDHVGGYTTDFLMAAHPDGVKNNVPTAIICPPRIYGVGEGPIKTHSIHIPYLSEAILKRGRGTQDIHVGDVSRACVLLIEEALRPRAAKLNGGSEGYHFVESGQFA